METREKERQEACERRLTEEELSEVLKSKERFRRVPTNYAVAKTKLLKDLVGNFSLWDDCKMRPLANG